MPPETQSTASSLDPQAVNMAKAIRQVESGGNFQSKGKSGEYGAYQYTPGTWAKQSAEAGVNVPLDQATPEQQNEVAYKQIKAWKDQGYDVGQIASMWNAGPGAPDAYLDPSYKGTNSHGVQYDVPGYAEKVAEAYQALKGQSPTQNAQTSKPSQPTDWLSGALGVGAGILGSLGGIAAKFAPEIGSVAGEGAAGPVGAVVGGIGGGIIQNMFGGGDNSGGSGGSGGGGTDPFQNQNINMEDLNVQPSKQSEMLSNIIHEAMQGTKSDRNISGSPSGKQAIDSMGLYGYAPDVDESGNMSFQSSLKKSQDNESKAAEMETLAAGNGKVPMASVINEAGNYLGGNKMMTPDMREEAAKLVGDYARAYAPANDSIEAGRAVQARHEQYRATKGQYGKLSTAQIEARKALAYGFRQASLGHSANRELQEAAIKEQQKHINAQSIMRRLEGKKAPKHHPNLMKSAIMKTAARYAEIYIGDKIGGPIGAILGFYVGGQLNRAVDKNLTKNKFETKEMKAAMDILHETKPEVYDRIIEALKKHGVDYQGQKEPENHTAAEHQKDVKGDLKTIKGFVDRSSVAKGPTQGKGKRKPPQEGLVKPPSQR